MEGFEWAVLPAEDERAEQWWKRRVHMKMRWSHKWQRNRFGVERRKMAVQFVGAVEVGAGCGETAQPFAD